MSQSDYNLAFNKCDSYLEFFKDYLEKRNFSLNNESPKRLVKRTPIEKYNSVIKFLSKEKKNSIIASLGIFAMDFSSFYNCNGNITVYALWELEYDSQNLTTNVEDMEIQK